MERFDQISCRPYDLHDHFDRIYREIYHRIYHQAYEQGYRDGSRSAYHKGYERALRDHHHNERSLADQRLTDMRWRGKKSRSWSWV